MSEYEEMLYAAGWITAVDVDDEYREHVKSAPEEFDYEVFLSIKQELKEAVADYDTWCEENFNHLAPGEYLSSRKKDEQNIKLSNISWLEYLLGY